MAEISNYDQLDYDYSTYWQGREYENRAEKNILNKIFSSKRGSWFLDIGGSYGRLASTYYFQYEKTLIIDYSLKTLQKNSETIKNKYPNIEIVAANAYKMPFKENTFDGALMVRVLHHIEDPKSYYKELRRVMRNRSTYVQEFANKIHIKARIKSLFKLNFDIYNKEPYQQPQSNNSEGSTKEEGSIFYNFHPQYIKDFLQENGFTVKKQYACSFFRIPLLKKIINTEIILFFEKIFSTLFSWTNITPSIFFETILEKKQVEETTSFTQLEHVLACPKCKKEITFLNNQTLKCKNCKNEYYKKEGVWDFRIK